MKNVIPMYIYSRMPYQTISEDLTEYCEKNNIKIILLERKYYDEVFTISPKKDTSKINGAVIYARFSCSNQKEISITGQLTDSLSYCERKGLAVTAIYADLAQTGTNSRRVAFQRLNHEILEEKYNGYSYVVYSTNRFARNRKLCSLYKSIYKSLGIDVVYSSMAMDDSPEGKLMEGTMEVLDEYFSNNLSKIVMRGMYERANQCKYTGGKVPYGYQINPVTQLYEVNEAEAVNVRMAFKMYNEKRGYTEILRAITENGARTRGGKPFSKNSLCDMISNPKYMGTYVYNRRSSKNPDNGKRNSHSYKSRESMICIPNGIPAIVDEKTYMLAQSRKEDNRKGVRSRREKENYLLTGLIHCKECGHAFTGNVRYSGRNKRKYVTYRCTNHNKGEKCPCKEVNRDYLESFVLDYLLHTVLAEDKTKELYKDFVKYQKERDTEYQTRMKGLLNEKNAVEQEKENLLRALEKNIATEDVLHRIDKKNREMDYINLQISELERSKPEEITEAQFTALIKKTRKLIRERKIGELKKFISYYVKDIIVGKDDITVILSYGNIVLLLGGGGGN